MNPLRRVWIWLSRIHCCRGFGVQSPTDYAFVRYVLNEHWPYYAYEGLFADDWLKKKKGQLFLRLANWRQPRQMAVDDWQEWWHAGCRRVRFVNGIQELERVELARLSVDDMMGWKSLSGRCDERSVVVVDDIYKNWKQWHAIEHDEKTGTTFDLYYCGVVFFDKERFNHHYIINF